MANISNPASIPEAKRDSIIAVLQRFAPSLVPAAFPLDENGEPVAVLNAEQVDALFEAVTRKFWWDLITQVEVELAAETARDTALAANTDDPFA